MSRIGFCSTSVQQLSDKKELCKTAMMYRSVKKRAKDTYTVMDGCIFLNKCPTRMCLTKRERERSEKSLLHACVSVSLKFNQHNLAPSIHQDVLCRADTDIHFHAVRRQTYIFISPQPRRPKGLQKVSPTKQLQDWWLLLLHIHNSG